MSLIDKKTKVSAAEKFNVTLVTLRKWVRRHESVGESGLNDRSSRPHNNPNDTPPEKVAEIITLRKEGKLTGDHKGRKLSITQRTPVAISCRPIFLVQKILPRRRIRLSATSTTNLET